MSEVRKGRVGGIAGVCVGVLCDVVLGSATVAVYRAIDGGRVQSEIERPAYSGPVPINYCVQ